MNEYKIKDIARETGRSETYIRRKILDIPPFVFNGLATIIRPDDAEKAIAAFKLDAEDGAAIYATPDLIGRYNKNNLYQFALGGTKYFPGCDTFCQKRFEHGCIYIADKGEPDLDHGTTVERIGIIRWKKYHAIADSIPLPESEVNQ